MNQETIQTAIRSTYENAQRFLKDSKILQKKGSYGHATSLAILGYEEAMKAFQLAKFHPFLKEFYSKDDLELLKQRLSTSHFWKQNYALEFRIALEAILNSDIITDLERLELGFPSRKDLQMGTEFAISEKLLDMKNDGFYVDAFREPFWSPSDTSKTTVKFAQKILETQLESIEAVVEFFTKLDKLPEQSRQELRQDLDDFIAILTQAKKDGVRNLAVIEERLSKFGIFARIFPILAKARITDERFKLVKKDKKKQEES